MQRLIYQNILGENVTFYHAPYVLCRVQGVGMNEMRTSTMKGSGQQGESLRAIDRESRKIKLSLHLMANSRQEMYRLRSELLSVMSPEKAFDGSNRAKLFYENDYCMRWTWAVPENGLDWGTRKQNVHPEVKLNFLCESPFWYGMQQNRISFRKREGGLVLPMIFPFNLGNKNFDQTVINTGQTSVPVSVEMVGNGEMPRLQNLTTGAEIALVRQLPLGDRLLVETDPVALRVSIRHPDGSEENGFGMLDPESSVAAFMLKPGENRLKYTAGEAGSNSEVNLCWYERFEGV